MNLRREGVQYSAVKRNSEDEQCYPGNKAFSKIFNFSKIEEKGHSTYFSLLREFIGGSTL